MELLRSSTIVQFSISKLFTLNLTCNISRGQRNYSDIAYARRYRLQPRTSGHNLSYCQAIYSTNGLFISFEELREKQIVFGQTPNAGIPITHPLNPFYGTPFDTIMNFLFRTSSYKYKIGNCIEVLIKWVSYVYKLWKKVFTYSSCKKIKLVGWIVYI